MDLELNEETRWKDVTKIITRDTAFKPEQFDEYREAFEEDISTYHNCPVLVIGAGGLGCDILKCLALSGVRDIHVIDLDTVDLTNLNRQFLFRHSDIDKPKCETAAKMINSRVKGVKVTPHYGKIQDKNEDFYKMFPVIIAGLDNVKARRWLNTLVHSLVQFDDEGNIDESTVIPLIDGGTEAFKGQARVIIPYKTACYECTLGTLPQNTLANPCTVATKPRLPEHCVQYAFEIQWPKEFPQKKYDTDSFEDMNWIYERALQRAKEHQIEGVTYNLTLGVVKNIIPSIASTNAIIAAACVNEAIKILSQASTTLSNYWQYLGQSGISSLTYEPEKQADCLVCSGKPQTVTLSKKDTLEFLIDEILKKQPFELQNPTLLTAGKPLFQPFNLEFFKDRLSKSFQELIDGKIYAEGDNIEVADVAVNGNLKVRLVFE